MCEEIAKSEQRIQVTTVKRKFGKMTTLVSGFEKGIDIKKLAKELKAELGCGGTVKDNVVELQGDHKKKVKPALIRQGFAEESIVID